MNRFLFLLSFFGFFSTLSAQVFPVRGEVVVASDDSPLIGAYVFLSQEGKEPTHQTTTDYDGRFAFNEVPSGEYDLKITYLGFQDLERTVTVTTQDLLLGKLMLKAGIDLSEVVVTEKVVPVTQNGDTTSLNAAAYKTLADASAEDLIEKMPTITVTDGKVQAQGEDVTRVLVDGKPFFGDDPTATLRNIPAEIIQSIEIFDQQSDQAAFTGFDDGQETKTINIVTKTTMRNGTFGQVYGGYGTDDRYEAGMSINNFSGDRRISVVGLSNNVNRQNFSSEDLLGVTSSASGGGRGARGGGGGGGRGGSSRGGAGGTSSASNFLVNDQSGIVTSNAFGLNYSDQWGENLTVSGSYFFNRSNSDTELDLTRQFFDAEGLQEKYAESSLIDNTNTNHRFNGRLEWTANANNSFIWQPRLSWQGNDGVESTLGNTFLGNELLNATENQYTAQLQALKVDNSLLWRHKFDKARRTLSVNLSGGFNPSIGTSQLLFSEQMGLDSVAVVSADQMATLDQDRLSGSVRIQYTEPVGRSMMFTVRSNTNIQREDNEQLTFLKEEGSDTYDLLDESLSGIAANDYLSQDVGIGLNYRRSGFSFNAQAAVQYANLMTESVLPAEPVAGKTFWNVLPSLSVRLRPSKTENFSFNYRSNTDLPDIDQLQEVVRNDNPLFLTVGNANLTQATQHRVFARYNLTKPESSSVFFALLGGGYTDNAISSSTFLSGEDFGGDFAVPDGAQITQSVNLDNNWNLRALATYGFPLKPFSSNLNVDLSGNYSNVPGLINGQLNVAKTTSTGLGLTLASNISDRLDFTVSSRTSMNWATNNLQAASNDEYLSQQSRLKFAWVIGSGIVFRTDLTHQLYRGLDDAFDQDFLLWNLSIGKKVFAGDRGEISLGAFDLLNQNISLTRNITETYSEDIQTNALGQYVKLSFKYDLRSFK